MINIKLFNVTKTYTTADIHSFSCLIDQERSMIDSDRSKIEDVNVRSSTYFSMKFEM